MSGSPRRRRTALGVAAVLALGARPAAAADEATIRPYDVSYDVRIVPSERAAHVTLRLDSGASLVHSITLRIDPERHVEFSADGELSRKENSVRWEPPKGGGALRYIFRIDHLRDAASYDSLCAKNWALFRGDDLVPPARVVTEDHARSRARLRLRLPKGWSVAVPYPRRSDGSFTVDHPFRRFDRPTGWFVMGHLGVLRENIAGTAVAVAGPVGQGFRRHDMLALLRWTMPSLRQILGTPLDRLLIVGAGDPMWRGGLSGPRSVFVHADRPLITTDGTSPVLHELMHAAMGARSGPGGDWIVEGLAEYYGLELLVRSKTVSKRRYRKALEKLRERGRSVRKLGVEHATGAVTARAVTVLHELDAAIRQATEKKASLDQVVARFAADPVRITAGHLRAVVAEVVGHDLTVFFRRYLSDREAPPPPAPPLVGPTRP